MHIKLFSGHRVVIVLIGALLALVVQSGSASFALAAPPDHDDGFQTFTRDVFVIVGSTLRNPDATTSPGASLYTNSGIWLEKTWGDWQAATATSTARVKGSPSRGRTAVRIHLEGLIPGGVYSIFYGTLNPDSENSLCPGVERTLPLIQDQPDASSPDSSSFIAGADGQVDYRATVDTDLFVATQVFYSVVYHFDGMTYGSLPNHGEFLTQGEKCRSSFGEDAMRQLILFQKFQ